MPPRKPFFEPLREAVARFAQGVHRLGAPASAADRAGLPAALDDFYASFDGAELFVDTLRILPAAEVERDAPRFWFAESADGDRYALDTRAEPAPVIRAEAETGDELVEGSALAPWLEGVLAAEAVVFDREGEYKDDLFDESGEGFSPLVLLRREERRLKKDPGAPAPRWRKAQALRLLGKDEEALALLTALVAEQPDFAWASYDLGRLRLKQDDCVGAEAAFLAAARGAPDPGQAGHFLAQAARAARQRGDEATRAIHAAAAQAADDGLGRALKQAALDEDPDAPVEERRERFELALAIAPRDLELLAASRALAPH